MRRTLTAAMVLFIGLLGGCNSCSTPATVPDEQRPPMPDGPPTLVTGLQVYERQCSWCHGAYGLGDGPAAHLLNPKPRDFSSGQFRLGSTTSGLPSDEDLLETLKRGMPGSAMPSWAGLSDEELDGLVAAIRFLAVEGAVKREGAVGDEAAKLRTELHEEYKPGPAVQLAAEPPRTAKQLAAGKVIFETTCAPCHGKTGDGKVATVLRNEAGLITPARDFTQGIFKGGSAPQKIATRIRRGIPGTAMPALPMSDEDTWAAVHYVQTLVKSDVQERVEQKVQALRVPRVASVDLDPDAPSWASAPQTRVPLMQLWWREERIDEFAFSAQHDGSRIAIRLVWSDATRNDSALEQRAFTDGAAVELSSSENPPFFAMGDLGDTTNIWHWKATWERDRRDGRPTLSSAYPHMVDSDSSQHAGFDTGETAGNPIARKRHPSSVEELNARGFGTLTSQPLSAQSVDGRAEWRDSQWSVVFVRDLGPAEHGDVALLQGTQLNVAFALWDGAHLDRNGQKAVTIWHTLEIE